MVWGLSGWYPSYKWDTKIVVFGEKKSYCEQETLMMIPDCHRRLVAAHADIKNVLASEVRISISIKSIVV